MAQARACAFEIRNSLRVGYLRVHLSRRAWLSLVHPLRRPTGSISGSVPVVSPLRQRGTSPGARDVTALPGIEADVPCAAIAADIGAVSTPGPGLGSPTATSSARVLLHRPSTDAAVRVEDDSGRAAACGLEECGVRFRRREGPAPRVDDGPQLRQPAAESGQRASRWHRAAPHVTSGALRNGRHGPGRPQVRRLAGRSGDASVAGGRSARPTPITPEASSRPSISRALTVPPRPLPPLARCCPSYPRSASTGRLTLGRTACAATPC